MPGMIPAAGTGKRLKWLTRDHTTCRVKFNGVTLIDRMLHQLDSFAVSVLTSPLEDPRDTPAPPDKCESWMDGTRVKPAEVDSIEGLRGPSACRHPGLGRCGPDCVPEKGRRHLEHHFLWRALSPGRRELQAGQCRGLVRSRTARAGFMAELAPWRT